MTLNKLCELFDISEITDTEMDIDKEYYASTEDIYSDGNVKSNINKSGYIHITSVQSASYLIYADRQYHTCLCIYKYADESNYKEIIDKLAMLKSDIKYSNHHSTNTNKFINNDVIDINNFICTECKSNDIVFSRSKTNSEAIEARCINCKTEYTFIPSKYYKMASKRIIYFKSNASRQIKIKDIKKDKVIIPAINKTEKEEKPKENKKNEQKSSETT